MKENGLVGKQLEKVNFFYLTEILMKAIGKMIKRQVMVVSSLLLKSI